MEIKANTVVQQLYQYMVLSLTHTQALYMFNNPTMEWTKGKQLAVYPRRNSCKMSETAGTQTHRVEYPAASECSKRRRDELTQVEKCMTWHFRKFTTECYRQQTNKTKKHKPSHGEEHMCTYTAGKLAPANDSQFADPQSAHMAPLPLLIRD